VPNGPRTITTTPVREHGNEVTEHEDTSHRSTGEWTTGEGKGEEGENDQYERRGERRKKQYFSPSPFL
jgi:hypothetical protein